MSADVLGENSRQLDQRRERNVFHRLAVYSEGRRASHVLQSGGDGRISKKWSKYVGKNQ